MAEPRLNLHGVQTLLIDSDHFTRGLIANMLRGFGMDSPIIVGTSDEGKEHLLKQVPDIILLDAFARKVEGSDLIRWIRRQKKGNLRFVPIIVLTGYTQLHTVVESRDAGANLVVKKPIAPQTLFDRLSWVAQTERPFIEAEGYCGPDRRFCDVPPLDGTRKRDTDGDEVSPVESPQELQQPNLRQKFGSK